MWIKLEQYPSPFDKCDECDHRNTPLAASYGRFICVHCVSAMALAIDMVPKADYVAVAGRCETAVARAATLDEQRVRLEEQLTTLLAERDVAQREAQRLRLEHADLHRQLNDVREAAADLKRQLDDARDAREADRSRAARDTREAATA